MREGPFPFTAKLPTLLAVESAMLPKPVLPRLCRKHGFRCCFVSLPLSLSEDLPADSPPAAVVLADDGLASAARTAQTWLEQLRAGFAGRAPVALVASENLDPDLLHLCRPDLVILHSNLETQLDCFLQSVSISAVRSSWPMGRSQAVLTGRVLVAEDNPAVQRLLARQLESAGVTATLASTGTEALALARVQHFDLILMDIEMPEMDGLTAALQLKVEGLTTPIIAITSHDPIQYRPLAISAGCVDLRPKPTSMHELAMICAPFLHNETGMLTPA